MEMLDEIEGIEQIEVPMLNRRIQGGFTRMFMMMSY